MNHPCETLSDAVKRTFLLLLCIGTVANARAGVFSEAFESGTGAWAVSGGWGTTAADAHSPTHSATDSHGAFYANNADTALTLAAPLDLSALARPALRFYHRHAIEPDYDWASVEVSTDGGVSWTELSAYTGSRAAWTREQLGLAAYAGQPAVKLRFRLVTDASVVMDGWYVDDVLVGEAPAAPVLTGAAAQGVSAVALAWEPSASVGVTAYRIYRSQSAGFDWHTAVPVGETAADVTEFTDIAAAPKAKFYYRVLAVSDEELHAESNELSVTLPPGMDYPFLDAGEAGGTTWIADGGWALSGERARSGALAWSDSPGTPYANSANAALRLAAPLNLSAARAPVLSFQQKHDILSGDAGVVEVSVNHGTDWTVLRTFSNTTSTNAWTGERVELAAYAGQAAVLVRFRLTTNASGQGDGWWLDDISVAESPAAVPSLLADQVTSHTLRLAWPRSTDAVFSHYAVHRVQAASGATRLSPRVAVIADPDQTEWTDTGLALNTEYAYRVYAVSPYGTYSPDGQEAATRTLNNPLPFADGFEDGPLNWTFLGTWGVTDEASASGNACLADSPLGLYANNLGSGNNYALTAVDLRGAAWPVLTFKDRHAFYDAAAGDRGILEVSPNGTSWTRVYGVTGARAEWAEQQIDLSRWRGEANLRIRFYIESNGSLVDDGWFIDDVAVAEHAPEGTQTLPFTDGFESGLGNWLNGGWAIATNGAYEGSAAAEGFPCRWTPQVRTHFMWMSLAKELDLSGTTAPQLTFWARRPQGGNDYRIYVRLSKNGGLNWIDLSGEVHPGAQWTRFQFAVPADYRVAGVRLAFTTYTYYESDPKLQVDKLTVEEAPPAVTLASPVPHLKSIDLAWTPQTLGADFQHFAIYRRESDKVTWADTLVATLTDPAATNFTDTGLSIGKTYYYRVYAVNDNDTHAASNEASATTVPVALPFADALDDLSQWDTLGAWGIEDGVLSDSPGAQYANSLGSGNNTAFTAVDLRGAAWPVLTFRDRHAFYDAAAGDRGILEVSPNGTSWTRVYGVTGARAEWAQQQIDLSRWRGEANLRIRFYIESNGSLVDDGWFIDDVAVAEHAPEGTQTLPFTDGFESGLGNWLNGGWGIATDGAYEGSSCAEAFPSRWTPQHRDHFMWLSLAKELDFSGMAAPQVTFWARRPQGDGYYRVYVRLSRNGGLNWLDLSGEVHPGADWTRFQYAVPADYRVAGVRLAVTTYTYYESNPKLEIDKLTVEETPPAVTLASPVPHLKSIDLAWTPQTLGGDFQCFAVYRRESDKVTWADTLVATLADPAATSFTDTGLSIGKTYHYRVYAVNSNDTHAASNEAQATTVPVTLPFTDALDDLSQWDVQGGWGIEEGALSDSPGVQYANSLGSGNNTALTAVDLRGAAWPVLTFRDRHAFYAAAAGDRGILEVSPNGTSWTRVYGVAGARAEWAQQQIDLSRWRGEANLRIRFYIESNGSLVDDGWFIDDVAVAEHAPEGTQTLPFTDGFESGLGNWLNGGWTAATDGAYEGSSSAEAFPNRWTPQVRDHFAWLSLARELDLSGAVAPQVTFWARRPQGDGYYRVYVRLSRNGGLNWLDLSGEVHPGADWTRFQYAVPADYRVAGVRMAVTTYTYYESNPKLEIDKLTVEDSPPAVTLEPPSDATISGLILNWSAYAGEAFQCYKVYRHTAQNVNETHTLLATVTDPQTTQFVDAALSARTRYFYKVSVYNANDTGTPSNEASAQTPGVPLGWSDSFDGAQPDMAWTFTGTWGLQAGAGVDGSAALTDSPGDYANSSDTWAQTAIDLSAAVWPVLTFKDRHALPPSGDSAYVEIGAADNNNIASVTWHTVYSTRESRAAWREQQIDLSRWKGLHTVYIRFRLATNSSVTDDGWAIDDVAVREHVPEVQAASLYERFENGLGDWLNGGWTVSTNAPYEGGACALNHDSQIVQGWTDSFLVYGRELDLASAADPKVTLWARGWRGSYGQFYVRLSKDGGVTWLDLTGIMAVTEPWTRFQYAVPAAYRTNNVRVALISYTYRYDTDSKLFIDAFGVGDETPGAPVPLAPAEGATATVLRPALTVANAVDNQTDPLTYAFEVYASADLSEGSLVAQNPAIASGASATSWLLDADLADETQYWWRCRATDGNGNAGPWSATATFYVSLVNAPPDAPVLVSPYADATLPDADGWFVWFASEDSDAGDAVTGYELEIAADDGFTNVLVAADVAAQPAALLAQMKGLPGYDALALNARYYWRVRALDGFGAPSAWSAAPFIYGALSGEPDPDPEPVTITGIVIADGTVNLTWTASEWLVRVEFSPSLSEPQWTTVAGAAGLTGTGHSFALPAGQPQGFFRVVVEE